MSVTYAPSQLVKGSMATFFKQLTGEKSSFVDRLATRIPSSAGSETHAWMGEAPQMSETVGEITFTPMSDDSYTLTNKDYSGGIAFTRRQFKDDQSGGVPMRIRQLASVAAKHPNKLVIQSLIDATSSTLGLDVFAEAFFGNTHAARGQQTSSQDNLLAGSGTTTAQVAADINSGLSELLNFVAENQEPFREDVSRVAIVAPPALMKPFKEALNAGVISQTSNVQLEGLSLDLLFTSRLTSDDANDWYMLAVDGPVKPLLFQDREPLEFVAMDKPDDEGVFTKEHFRYKARATYAVGYGQWANAVKFVNS